MALSVRITQAVPDAGISDALIERGLLGIFALVAGLLIWRFISDQRADLLAARAQRDAMVKDVVELVIPAVTKSTALLERTGALLERQGPLDDRMAALLERIERGLPGESRGA